MWLGRAQGLAAGGGFVWVSFRYQWEATRIDAATGAVEVMKLDAPADALLFEDGVLYGCGLNDTDGNGQFYMMAGGPS